MRLESDLPPTIADQQQAADYLVYAQVAEWVRADVEQGKAPDIEGLAKQFPDQAEHIRQLVPSLLALYELGCRDSSLPGAGPAGSKARDLAGGHAALGVIGDFQLIRELGRGGMGVVYEARQVSLNRRVALKVLSLSGVPDPRQLQRFRHEARAAAHLHHPHIVDVFAVGSDRGIHYYAMRYIEGQTFAQFISQLAQAQDETQPGSPRLLVSKGSQAASDQARNSTVTAPDGHAPPPGGTTAGDANDHQQGKAAAPRQRGPALIRGIAELFWEVAEALHHAHQEGIIHRDIKPSNLLIDLEGKAWVTDFGLARFEAQPGATVTGDLLGTLRYMSPEQALGQHALVDRRTDIYSLGATLYEFLALRPAMDQSERHKLIHDIALVNPPSVRHWNPRIPRDLEAILSKAMEKRPDDRYPTAAELAADLRRFLDGQPVVAKIPGFSERVARWSRRHRAVVQMAMVAMVLVTLISGATASWLWHVAQHNTQLTRTAELKTAQAERRRQEVIRQRELAESQRRVFQQFFLELARDPRLRQPGMEHLRSECLATARRFLEQFSTVALTEPESLLEQAELLRELGQSLAQQGSGTHALDCYQQARRILSQLIRRETNVDARWTLGAVEVDIGLLYTDTGRLADAESMLQSARARFAELIGQQTGNLVYWRSHVQVLQNLGVVWNATGQRAEAYRALEQVLPELEQVAASQSDPRFSMLLANHLNNLAALGSERNWASNEAILERVVDIVGPLVTADPDKAEYRVTAAAALMNLADQQIDRQQWDLAESRLRQALAHYRHLTEVYANVAEYPSRVAGTCQRIAEVFQYQQRYAEAWEWLRQGLGVAQQLVLDYPQDPGLENALADAYRRVAAALCQPHPAQDRSEAERYLRRALDLGERIVQQYPDAAQYWFDHAVTYNHLALFYAQEQRWSDSRSAAESAIAIRQRLVRQHPSHPAFQATLAEDYLNRGVLERDAGNSDQAVPWLEQAAAAYRQLLNDAPESRVAEAGLTRTRRILSAIESR